MSQNVTGTPGDNKWECIDPTVGTCLWEMEISETSPQRLEELKAHLDFCDACRLDHSLEQQLSSGLVEGKLKLQVSSNVVTPPAAWWSRPALPGAVGSLLVAACLSLLMLMPPVPSGDLVNLRGDSDEMAFLRPVEGEVVHAKRGGMSWKPVPGATSYQITLSEVGGGFVWNETTTATRLALPVLESRSEGHYLRASLTTVPKDLVPPGSISVVFSTGNNSDVVQYRLKKAPNWIILMGFGGILFLGLFVAISLNSKKNIVVR